MPKELFLANDFVATKFSTAADKANFGNLLLHFIDSGWKQTIFTEKFYSRLSMCFGHIAHCDRSGFYETWFRDDHQRLHFLRHALASHCWGSPEFTFCDVERAIQREIRNRNYVALYELRAVECLRTAEMAVLQRLEAKYRTSVQQTSQDTEDRATFRPSETDPGKSTTPAVQACLF